MLSHLLLTLPMLLCLAALLLRCAAAWGASPNLFRRFPSLWGEPQRTEEERCPEQRSLIFTQLDFIPRDGSQLDLELCGLSLHVEEVREHRIERILIKKQEKPEISEI